MESSDELTKSVHHSTLQEKILIAMSYLAKAKTEAKTKRREKTKPPEEDNSGKKKTQ